MPAVWLGALLPMTLVRSIWATLAEAATYSNGMSSPSLIHQTALTGTFIDVLSERADGGASLLPGNAFLLALSRRVAHKTNAGRLLQ